MSLLFRSFYALPPMNTPDGTPTNALYGVSVLWLKLVREHGPRALAFAVDLPKPTFRHTQFPAYKQGRPTTPDPLVSQVARYGVWMASLGVPVHAAEGFEADDILATLAADPEVDGLVVTGDTDLFQVVDERIGVWYIGRRQQDSVLMDVTAVEQRYGLRASAVPTIKAFVGDPSDNLPGLPGIGPKTAAKWIRMHGDARGIVANVDTLTPARHRDTVRAHADELPTWEMLATVRRDVPLAAPAVGPLTEASFQAMDEQFRELHFNSLRPRLEALAERWTSNASDDEPMT